MDDGTTREVALDPRWLPHTYDIDGAALTSVFVPRESHAELMFLSDEHFAGRFPKVTHRAADVAAEAAHAQAAPLHFIFHTAFCGSTLMAKALDASPRAFGLKEPDVLINLANRFIRSDDRANRERLRLVLRLLARPFGAGETVIAKPTNFANRLAVPALELLPESRAVLLYSDLRTLLRSILKRGMWGRIWGRKLFRNAASWTTLDFGYDAEETFLLTDLQTLGLGWLMQIHHFSEVAKRMSGRTMIVDSADFLGDPAHTLLRVSDFLDLEMGDSTVAEIVAGPVFAHHSKLSDRDYGRSERAAEESIIEATHGKEIDMVVKWVEAVARHVKVELRPSA